VNAPDRDHRGASRPAARDGALTRVALAMRLLVAAVCTTVATPLAAQVALHGQVRVIDRPGTPPADLRDVVIWLEGAASPRVSPATVSVAMRLREFEPHVAVVPVGGAVTYPNQDPFSHNVFSNSSLGAFDLGLYRTGKTRAATFARAGVYAVYCNIHARMVNYVVAVPTPYVARATAAGNFTVTGLSAGRWRLHVWHERAPEHVEEIVITTAQAPTPTIALDGRGFQAKAHLNKFGQVYATSRADRY